MSEQKNWKGQPLHPVDGFTWFRTSDEEREKYIKMYDQLVQGDPEKAKLFEKLVTEFRWIATLEAEYNAGDC